MKNQKGFAPLVALAVIVGALAIGVIFQKATKTINHPVEQAAERVLSEHGIDIDFSADKIKARDKALNK